MNITSAKQGTAEIKLRVELSEMEMAVYSEKAIEKLSKQVNVKGFRPGKVPLSVAQESIDPKYLAAYTIDLAIPPTYTEAIKDQKIEPIGRPSVNIISESPFVYEAIVPIYPEVTVKDLKSIKLTAKKVEVSQADQDEEIKRFQVMHAVYSDVDRAAEIGDRAEIDFNGFDEGGVPLEGTTSKNHPLILGDNSFVPGFEEQVVGMKKTEDRDISVVFPADYFHKPFQGKKVIFKIKLNRLEQRTLPAIDAELIKKITGKEITQEQFIIELKANLLKARQQEETTRLENELLEQIEKNTTVELAHSLIDEEIQFMNDEQKRELEQRGINWEQYLEAVQKTEKDLHDEKHSEAEKRLRLRFGVQEVFKLEKVEISDEELNKAFQDEMKIFSAMNYEPKMEEQEVFKTRLRNKLKMEKMVAIFTK